MNTELRSIIDEIDLLENRIADLRKKRDEIKKEPQKQKMKVFWDAVKQKEDKVEIAMESIAKGEPAPKAATLVGLTANYVNQNIWKVWKKRYPKHYKANEKRIRDLGIITALRYSPPIFQTKTK
jgi:hypothetical protein